MKVILLLSCSLGVLMMSACQPASPTQQLMVDQTPTREKSKQARVAVTSASVNGSWKSECSIDPKTGLNYREDTLEIVSDQITISTHYFSERKCKHAQFSQTL